MKLIISNIRDISIVVNDHTKVMNASLSVNVIPVDLCFGEYFDYQGNDSQSS